LNEKPKSGKKAEENILEGEHSYDKKRRKERPVMRFIIASIWSA
jgi:hypothetical protein